MSSLMIARDAVAMVPGWDAASAQIDELTGGLTNRTYHVRCGDQEGVLRINVLPTRSILPDRSCELAILARACKAGVAPGIIFADIDQGILLTEFLRGAVWQEADIRSPDNVECLANVLRRVHALPLCGYRIDLKHFARRYAEALQECHALQDVATRCVGVIDSIPTRDTLVCCHNDVIAGNIIGSTPAKMIDWEYAGDNDPLFDLASVIGYHDFDQQSALHLLRAYAGGGDPELQESLAEQLRLYDAIQWLWLASRQQTSANHRQAARLLALQKRIR